MIANISNRINKFLKLKKEKKKGEKSINETKRNEKTPLILNLEEERGEAKISGRRTVTSRLIRKLNRLLVVSPLPPPLSPQLFLLSVLFFHRFHRSSSLVLFFFLFSSLLFCSDVGLYDPHAVYETRGRIDGRNARVRSSPPVPLARRPQWGHMSKQLAHRCIEFTEENGGGRSKESWCCVIGAPPWARSSSTGRSTSRDGCCSPSFLFPGMEKNSC